MPNIDFYIIKQPSESDLVFFTCRLIEKIFQQGREAYIHVASKQFADSLNEILWTYRADSFVPHQLANIEKEYQAAISIGFEESFHGSKDVLINLSPSIPAFHVEFQRIAEIVRNDENSKQISREHWRFYQEQGYPLKKNEI